MCSLITLICYCIQNLCDTNLDKQPKTFTHFSRIEPFTSSAGVSYLSVSLYYV